MLPFLISKKPVKWNLFFSKVFRLTVLIGDLRYADEIIMWSFTFMYIVNYYITFTVSEFSIRISSPRVLTSSVVYITISFNCMFVTWFTGLQLFARNILLNILTMFVDKTDIKTDMNSLMLFGTTNKLLFIFFIIFFDNINYFNQKVINLTFLKNIILYKKNVHTQIKIYGHLNHNSISRCPLMLRSWNILNFGIYFLLLIVLKIKW